MSNTQSAGLELTGILKFKGETIAYGEKGFTKRLFWLEINQHMEWKETVEISLIKDKTSLIEKYNVGDTLRVDVNVRGRMGKLKNGEEKPFNELNAWRIGGAPTGDAPESANEAAPEVKDAEADDLPF